LGEMTYVYHIPRFMIAHSTCHAISKLTPHMYSGGYITGLCACTALWTVGEINLYHQRSTSTVQACGWAGVSTFVPSLAVPLLPPSSYVRLRIVVQSLPVVILVSFSLDSLRLGLVHFPLLPANCIRLLPDRCAVVPGYDAARTLSRTVVRL
jgi:hypothetical protein